MWTAKRLPICAGLLAVLFLLLIPDGAAHPGSAIAVDDENRVYFVQTFKHVWSADADGNLTAHDGPAWHFMAIDAGERFAGRRWAHYLEPVRPGVVDYGDSEVQAVGTAPTLLLASSFPIAFGEDGTLYYAEPDRNEAMHICRQDASGPPTHYAQIPVPIEFLPSGEPGKALWIHGLARGPHGSLYYAEKTSVRRVDADGTVSMIAEDIVAPGCTGHPRGGPILRGLDVAPDGTVYVASVACAAVLRIAPDSTVSTAVQSENPWVPTGVTLKDGDLYILEVWYAESDRPESWRPRVRKMTADGRVVPWAEVPADESP